jgi:uncharacterized protein DUF2628
MQPPTSVPPHPADNPYAPPRAATDLGEATVEGDGLTDAEIVAFVDQNVAYYRSAWARANHSGGFYAGFNVGALVFSTLWLLYRKMYLAFVVFLVVQMAGMFVAAFVATLLGVHAMLAVWSVVIATKLTIGFLGNALYLRRARRVVGSGRGASSGEANLHYIRTQGGTSNGAVAVGIAINIGINLLTR